MKARWTQSCVRGLRIGAENRDKCVLGADPKKSDCDKDRMRDLRATTEALERGTSDAKGEVLSAKVCYGNSERDSWAKYVV